MTVADLITKLQEQPQDAEVTVIHMDFPYPVRTIEVEPCTRCDDHFHQAFYPKVEEEPIVKVVVLR